MFRDDVTRMRHMLDAAKEAVGFMQGCDRSALERNRVLALGLLKSIEIVGEAATRVGAERQGRYPRTPGATSSV